MNRRTAVSTVASVAAGAIGVPAAWESVLRRPRIRPVGIQLYTVRDAMSRSVSRTLAAIAEMGYEEVEFAGYFDHAPAEIATMLRDIGLVSPASHVGFEAMTNAWDETLEAAAAIGNTHVIVPWAPEDARRTISDYHRLADMFNAAGETARAAGLRFGYHNHDFEFARIDDTVPYDVLCENTDPELVDFELDIFWIVNGGDDPMRVFGRWPGRFPMVHIKDRSPEGEQVDIGAGTIEWAAVLAAGPGIRHFFIEHDNPADPMGFARRGYGYISNL